MATREIELADVIAVQALGTTGWQPVPLDIQFPRLEIRAQEMPNKVAKLPDKVADIDPAAKIEQAQVERVEFRFRDGFANNPMLRLVGEDADAMAVVQPQGLRFNVPAGRKNTDYVGVESRLRLRGDFEITLAYELVGLPDPPPPLGAGAALKILLDTQESRMAVMDRLHRPADAVFGANVIISDKHRHLMVEAADAKETKGQLRMVRTGKKLSYQIQEGSPDFHEFATFEIGDTDVIGVQALAAAGWQPVAVGVRFPRLELRLQQDRRTDCD